MGRKIHSLLFLHVLVSCKVKGLDYILSLLRPPSSLKVGVLIYLVYSHAVQSKSLLTEKNSDITFFLSSFDWPVGLVVRDPDC